MTLPNPRNLARERMLAARNAEIRRRVTEQGLAPKMVADMFGLHISRIYQIVKESPCATQPEPQN